MSSRVSVAARAAVAERDGCDRDDADVAARFSAVRAGVAVRAVVVATRDIAPRGADVVVRIDSGAVVRAVTDVVVPRD